MFLAKGGRVRRMATGGIVGLGRTLQRMGFAWKRYRGVDPVALTDDDLELEQQVG